MLAKKSANPARLPWWGLLSRRSVNGDRSTELYGRLVTQARNPAFYAQFGVPDTAEGRLELVMLHVVLALRRLAREGETAALLGPALTETFVTDIDDCLREMGVGDLAVAKKVQKAAAALFDRSRDYGRTLGDGDHASLALLIERHVMVPDTPVTAAGPNAERIARYAFDMAAAQAAASLEAIVKGAAALPEISAAEGGAP